MSSQHKRPFMAFIVLVVLAAALIGNGIRANAEHGRFIAAGVISASTPLVHGTLPGSDGGPSVLPAAAGLVAAATPSQAAAPEAAAAPAPRAVHPSRTHAAPRSRVTHHAHPAPGRVRAVVRGAVGSVVAAPRPGLGHAYGRAHAPGQLAGHGRAARDTARHTDRHTDQGRHLGHDKHAAKLRERLLGH